MPITEGIFKYINEDITSFHMPGHKNNKRNFKELQKIQDNLYKMDNTEVPGLDNLHMPEDIILKSEQNAARIFKASKTYYLVNGSTSGVYSMILGTVKPKEKIIVLRNCHRSVYSACLLGDIKTEYIYPKVSSLFNIGVGIDINEVVKVIKENPDAKAVVLTYPTYYGTCADIKKISKEVHDRGMLLIVDEAHGAHFPFNDRLPKTSIELGADMAVTSLHKTLPSLTQTAILNLSEEANNSNIGFMTSLFQSTSPSYIFMASMESSLNIMENQGKALADEMIDEVLLFKERMKNLKSFMVMDMDHLKDDFVYDMDSLRLVIKSSFGGRKLEEILRSQYKIQVEMSDLNNIVLIVTVGNMKEDIKRLYEALYDIDKKYGYLNKINDYIIQIPKAEKVMSIHDAYYMKKKKVRLKEAKNLISGEMISPYPPGIPVILPGELITPEIIDTIISAKENDIQLNGMEDIQGEYINVVSSR